MGHPVNTIACYRLGYKKNMSTVSKTKQLTAKNFKMLERSKIKILQHNTAILRENQKLERKIIKTKIEEERIQHARKKIAEKRIKIIKLCEITERLRNSHVEDICLWSYKENKDLDEKLAALKENFKNAQKNKDRAKMTVISSQMQIISEKKKHAKIVEKRLPITDKKEKKKVKLLVKKYRTLGMRAKYLRKISRLKKKLIYLYEEKLKKNMENNKNPNISDNDEKSI